MTYNLHNPLDCDNARFRLEALIKRGGIVEITEKKPKRTIRQNQYLHLLLSYFAAQTGNTLEWVKQQYYKKLCNPDIFIGERQDQYLGRVKYVRSSAELTTKEMTDSIERFRNWSAAEAGIYLAEPNEEERLAAMQVEVDKYKLYL